MQDYVFYQTQLIVYNLCSICIKQIILDYDHFVFDKIDESYIIYTGLLKLMRIVFYLSRYIPWGGRENS